MSDIDDILEQVRGTIAGHLYVPPESVVSSAALTTDLGADSLDVMEICIALESLFDIEIEADQARAFRTVFDVASFLGRRVVAPGHQVVA